MRVTDAGVSRGGVRGIHAAALVLVVAVLTSCTAVETLPPVEDPEAQWRLHRISLEHMRSWHAVGRVAFRSERDGWSASFRWNQREGLFQIMLAAPLGIRRVSIEGDDEEVRLQTSDGRVSQARDAESLFHEQLGFRFPVGALRYWLVGLPGPGGDHRRELDTRGRLARLEQGGWEMRYSEYDQVGAVFLPQRIQLIRAPYRIKVLVSSWTPSSSQQAELRPQ